MTCTGTYILSSLDSQATNDKFVDPATAAAKKPFLLFLAELVIRNEAKNTRHANQVFIPLQHVTRSRVTRN